MSRLGDELDFNFSVDDDGRTVGCAADGTGEVVVDEETRIQGSKTLD